MAKRKVKGGQFREAFSYLRGSTSYVAAIALIFLGGILFGLIFSSQLGFLDAILRELVDKVKDLGAFDTILFILQNNLKSSLYVLLFGVILGLLPIFSSFSNGLILGYVMKIVYIETGFGEFWRILPHGVFEIPAVFISMALGLRLGMFIFTKNRGEEFIYRARNSMIIFVSIVIPLLIVAAIIEGLLIFAYK